MVRSGLARPLRSAVMLNPPSDLTEASLVDSLRHGWGLGPAASGLEYLPVGFGSHHWRFSDDRGDRWFLTVDDLTRRKRQIAEPLDAVHSRLRAALSTARAIADTGAGFLLAPIRREDGEVVTRVGTWYVAALFPFVAGRTHHFGEVLTRSDRDRIRSVVASLHAIPASVAPASLVEDFELRHRAELTDALDDLAAHWRTGPYAEPARVLLTDHADRVEELLARFDRLAAEGRARPDRMVLTHGEPHPGNVIETASGWVLVDWDTALLAPPERDLWFLDSPDDPHHEVYSDLTGSRVQPPMLEFYRLSWTLADIAAYISEFRQPHGDDANGRQSLIYLSETLQS